MRKCVILATMGILSMEAASAQAPVEERSVHQSPAASAQIRADVARRELTEADRALRFAQADEADARQKLKAAEKQLSDAQLQYDKSHQALEKARADKQRAQEALQRANADVERAWPRP